MNLLVYLVVRTLATMSEGSLFEFTLHSHSSSLSPSMSNTTARNDP